MKNVLFAIVALSLATGAVAATADEVERANDGVSAPYLIPESRVAPEYPPAAYDARIEGYVTLAALVRRDGSVASVETIDASAPGVGFEKAAAKAVERWRFEPGRKDGAAIDSYSIVRLNFRRASSAASSGHVTAAFVPLEMLRSSIVAPATGSTLGGSGTSMSSTSTTEADGYGVHAYGRVRDYWYDPEWAPIPDRELALIPGAPVLPPIGSEQK